MPSIGVPPVEDELERAELARGLDSIERRHVLDARRVVVADPRHVCSAEDAVTVVVPVGDAIEIHLPPGVRGERYPFVFPWLACHLIDWDVGEQIARALMDIGRAEGHVPGDLPLEVQSQEVGVLILEVVRNVERP